METPFSHFMCFMLRGCDKWVAELVSSPLYQDRFGLSLEHTFQATLPKPGKDLESSFQWLVRQYNGWEKDSRKKTQWTWCLVLSVCICTYLAWVWQLLARVARLLQVARTGAFPAATHQGQLCKRALQLQSPAGKLKAAGGVTRWSHGRGRH